MQTYPSFNAAVEEFKDFLSKQGRPNDIQWVFRDNVYTKRNAFFVTVPLPETNCGLAERAYNAGVTQDQIAMIAVAKLPNSVLATIWYPITEQQRPQGWEYGLRYVINEPLLDASKVRLGWRWRVRRITPAFRRYRKYANIHKDILSIDEVAQRFDSPE